MHALARRHLQKNEKTLSGMPGKDIFGTQLRKMNVNANYLLETKYVAYPSDVTPEIANCYLNFLKSEMESKKQDASFISFLNHENVLFISSSFSIDLFIRAFCEPQIDRVCILSPTFPLYAYCAHNNHVEVIDIPLEGNFFETPNLQRILHAKAKVVFIPAPNNPVGTMPNRNLIKKLADQLEGIIIIDEAYIEFSDQPSFIAELREHPNLAVVRSFSKGWGLAGIRCGATLAQKELIATLQQLLPPCYFPTPVQEILIEAFFNQNKILEMRKVVQEERALLYHYLKKSQLVQKVFPSESNFFLTQFYNTKWVFEGLFARGILVKRVDSLNALRLSLGTKEDNRYLLKCLDELSALRGCFK